MLVGYLGNAVDVGDTGIGVAEGLDDDGLGVGTEGGFDGCEIFGIDNGGADALGGEGVLNEVERASIEVVSGNDVVASMGHILQGIGDGGGSTGHCQSCHASFKGGYALFKNALGGVGEATVYVAGIAQTETVGSMLGVAEYIRGGLVNRYRT